MNRIVAVILICLLVAPPAWAGQQVGKPLTWEETQRLKGGTEIMLAVADGPPTKVKLLFADDSILVTLKPDAPKLPGKVQRALLQLGDRWPGIVNGTHSITSDEVRVSAEGVFFRDQKVAELAALVQQTLRGDIRGITDVPHSHRIWWVAGIAAAGAVVFLLVYNYISDAIAN